MKGRKPRIKTSPTLTNLPPKLSQTPSHRDPKLRIKRLLKATVSKQWAETILQAGAVMIDNSSAFRLDPQVPLVVPEVNPEALATHQGIIANPNCTTILLCVVLYPLHRVIPLERVIVSTYQSASGAGARGMHELLEQTRAVLAGDPPPPRGLSLPHCF